MLHRSVFIEMSGSCDLWHLFCNSFLQVLHPLRRMQLFCCILKDQNCVVCIRHVVSVYICGAAAASESRLVISALAARSAALSAVVTSPSLSTSPRSLASATLRVSARTAASHHPEERLCCRILSVLLLPLHPVRRWFLLHKRLRFQVLHLLCQGLLSELLC